MVPIGGNFIQIYFFWWSNKNYLQYCQSLESFNLNHQIFTFNFQNFDKSDSSQQWIKPMMSVEVFLNDGYLRSNLKRNLIWKSGGREASLKLTHAFRVFKSFDRNWGRKSKKKTVQTDRVSEGQSMHSQRGNGTAHLHVLHRLC